MVFSEVMFLILIITSAKCADCTQLNMYIYSLTSSHTFYLGIDDARFNSVKSLCINCCVRGMLSNSGNVRREREVNQTVMPV